MESKLLKPLDLSPLRFTISNILVDSMLNDTIKRNLIVLGKHIYTTIITFFNNLNKIKNINSNYKLKI